MPTKFANWLMVNRPSLEMISIIYASIASVEALWGDPARCLTLIFEFADPPVNMSQWQTLVSIHITQFMWLVTLLNAPSTCATPYLGYMYMYMGFDPVKNHTSKICYFLSEELLSWHYLVNLLCYSRTTYKTYFLLRKNAVWFSPCGISAIS